MGIEKQYIVKAVDTLRFHIRVAVPTLSIQTRVGDCRRGWELPLALTLGELSPKVTERACGGCGVAASLSQTLFNSLSLGLTPSVTAYAVPAPS